VVHTNNVVTDIYIQIKEIDVRFYKEASTSDPVLYLLDIVMDRYDHIITCFMSIDGPLPVRWAGPQ